jgi:phage-related protein
MGLFPAGGEFSIDGFSSDTWQMYMLDWTIAVIPSLRVNLVSVPGRVGKRSAGTEIDSRIVHLALSCVNPNRAALMANLRAFSAAVDPRGGPHKLCLTDDDPDYYIWVVPNSEVPTSPKIIKADMDVVFEACDPHWYYTTPRSYSWAASNATPLVVANTNGNTSTPVHLHLVGPPVGMAASITIGFGASTVTYTGGLAGTDYVDIDTDKFTVTKNGINDIAHWGGDDFPLLPIGAAVPITWYDTSNLGATVTVTYNERSI